MCLCVFAFHTQIVTEKPLKGPEYLPFRLISCFLDAFRSVMAVQQSLEGTSLVTEEAHVQETPSLSLYGQLSCERTDITNFLAYTVFLN